MPWRLDLTVGVLAVGLLNAIAKPVVSWMLFDADAPNLVSFLCASVGFAFWVQHRTHMDMPRYGAAVLAAAVLLLCIPVSFAAWASCAMIAAWRLVSGGDGRLERAGLVVLLVASLRTPIAEGAMTVLAEPLLRLDGVLANWVGLVLGGGGSLNENMILGADGHAVLVMSGCASFANVSHALLIWFTAATLFADRSRHFLSSMAAILCAAIVAINAIRLGGMTLSREHYRWIHDAAGASVAEGAMVITILAAIGLTLGMRSNARR